MFGQEKRRQPREVRPPPQGAASGDQGARGERPQLPLQRSSRHSTSFLARELASAGNSASLDVAPSYSRGRDETSRIGPNETSDSSCTSSYRSRRDRRRRSPRCRKEKTQDRSAESASPSRLPAPEQPPFSEFRKFRESHPDMFVHKFADFKLYFDAKQAAAKRRNGMDRPGRAWPSPESARSEGPRRNIRYYRLRDERHHRARDSRIMVVLF